MGLCFGPESHHCCEAIAQGSCACCAHSVVGLTTLLCSLLFRVHLPWHEHFIYTQSHKIIFAPWSTEANENSTHHQVPCGYSEHLLAGYVCSVLTLKEESGGSAEQLLCASVLRVPPVNLCASRMYLHAGLRNAPTPVSPESRRFPSTVGTLSLPIWTCFSSPGSFPIP